MAIDMASVYADRFRQNPNALRAAVMGQSPDPKLDSYTALNALRLIKEADMMAMSAQAQQPTSSPSILAETMAPPAPPQGLAGMPMGAPAGQMPQGQAPQPMPQAPAMQASGGLAGMPTPEENYAAGGIVAFQEGGLNTELTVPPGTPYSEDESGLYPAVAGEGGEDGDAGLQALAFKDSQETRNLIKGLTRGTITPEEDDAAVDRYMRQIEKFGGPNIYDPANKRLDEREGARSKNTRQGEGLALLAAAGAILEGNTLARGAAKAFPVFAKEMGEVQRADIAEQRSIEAMRFSLADAQRKERMGDIRGAQAARETARKNKADAATFELQKAQALATLDARALQATRTNAKGAGSGPKLAERLADAELEYRKNPTPETKAALEALSSAASKMKTSFSTSEIAPEKARTTTAPVLQRIDQQVTDALGKFKRSDPAGAAYRSAVRAGKTDEATRLLGIEEARLRKGFETSTNAASGDGGSSSGKPKVIKLD